MSPMWKAAAPVGLAVALVGYFAVDLINARPVLPTVKAPMEIATPDDAARTDPPTTSDDPSPPGDDDDGPGDIDTVIPEPDEIGPRQEDDNDGEGRERDEPASDDRDRRGDNPASEPQRPSRDDPPEPDRSRGPDRTDRSP
ncbi:MAG: hypothetical protein H0U28_13805, partial [Nocardioidaceae bacterium]|nr:hypothetical protein [Nocardioidaceae bacterium]